MYIFIQHVTFILYKRASCKVRTLLNINISFSIKKNDANGQMDKIVEKGI